MEVLEKNSEREILRHPITPEELDRMYPLDLGVSERIDQNRQAVNDILKGQDKRKIVVVGPCSLDEQIDSDGVPIIYRLGERVSALSKDPNINKNILLVMRTPPAKPRTNLGWVGLENTNLEKAYELMSNLANTGVPLAIELMHEKHFARFGGLLTMGWVGARNVEDTMLRHAVSAHNDIPVLFKNDSSGSVGSALDAIKTSGQPHKVDIIDQNNQLVEVDSVGNKSTGLILRGGDKIDGPEKFEKQIFETAEDDEPFLVDCAHGNAVAHGGQKTADGQLRALAHLSAMIKQSDIAGFRGIMLEAHLERGLSKTDDCIGADEMELAVAEIAQIVATK